MSVTEDQLAEMIMDDDGAGCAITSTPAAPRRYREGEIIRYPIPAVGWIPAQVMRYAPAGDVFYHGEANPMIYIRTRSGETPFPVRESGIRPRTATKGNG